MYKTKFWLFVFIPFPVHNLILHVYMAMTYAYGRKVMEVYSIRHRPVFWRELLWGKGYRGKNGEGGGFNVFWISSVSTRAALGIQCCYFTTMWIEHQPALQVSTFQLVIVQKWMSLTKWPQPHAWLSVPKTSINNIDTCHVDRTCTSD